MKTPRSRSRSNNGFTLAETALAVGLMAALTLPLLGLLGMGAAESGNARNHQRSARVREDLRMRLQDPAWPSESRAGHGWTAEFPYDHDGNLIRDTGRGAWMNVSLEGVEAPGFPSERYEAVRVKMVVAKTKRLLGETVIQRRKEDRS